MDPLTIGLITGGASLLGSLFSSNTSAQNTQAQIAAQEQMQLQNQQWQTQMSNTAYQRATKDMTAAGLNPMMMFGSGGAASTPSVGTPTVPMPQKSSGLAGLGTAVQQGVSSAIQAETYDKMKQEVANLQVEQTKTAAVRDLLQQQKQTEWYETTKKESESRIAQLGVAPAAISEKEALAIGDMPNWLFNTAVQGGYLGKKASDVIAPASDAVNLLTGSALRKYGIDKLRQEMTGTKKSVWESSGGASSVTRQSWE